MNRVTVERVKNAYEKTGLSPVFCTFYARDNTSIEKVIGACALGACFIAENPNDIPSSAVEERLGITSHYLYGFLRTFDNHPFDEREAELKGWNMDEFRAGVEDGIAAREVALELRGVA